MKNSLQFSSLFELVNFQGAIKMRSYRINTANLTLSGIFSEVEVELALESYNAILLDAEPVLERMAS